MTNRELQNIIEEIKKKGNVTLQEIAISIGKDRSYLSKLINSEPEKNITKALLRDFREIYPAYFPEDNKNNRNAAADSDLADQQETIAILKEWRKDVEKKYQDSNKRELALIAIINDYLKEMGPNLAQGQQQIKEQILTSSKLLGDLILRGTKESLLHEKGTGLSKRKPRVDGKGTGH
jgi:transcriptional regulator with XRE-family HTH domain